VLDRMSVLRCESHRSRKPVMELVNRRIEKGTVEKPVRVVEEDFSEECTEDNIANDLGEWREAGMEPELWFVVKHDRNGIEQEVEGRGNKLVAENDLDAVVYLCLLRLFLCRL